MTTIHEGEEHLDHVNLGSISEVVDGEALVMRRVAESAELAEGGLPSMDHQRRADRESDQASGWRKLLLELRSYREIRRTPYGFTPVVVLGLIFAFQILDSNAFLLATPEIADDLEINIPQILNIRSLVGVFAVFGALILGWWGDRNRRVPLVVWGTFVSGVFSIIGSRAQSSFSLGLPRIIDDVADEGATVPRFSLLADYYPPESRGRVFGLNAMFRGVGFLIAPLGAGVMIDTFGWRTAMAVLGVPLLVMAGVAALKLREPVRGYMERRALGADDDVAREEDEPQSFGEAWRTTFAVRTLRRFFMADIFVGAQDVFTSTFTLFLLREEYGLRATQIGLFLTPAVISQILGSMIGGGLVDRFTRKNPGRVTIVFGVYTILTSLIGIGFAITPPLAVLFFIYIFSRFTGSLVGPANRVVYANVVPPSVRTQGIQIAKMAELPGLIALTPVAGAIFVTSGYEGVFLASIIPGVIAGILYISAAPFYDLDVRRAYAASLADHEWREAKKSGKGKLLVCRDVDVEYDGVQVLFGVDFDVEEGQIIALLGTNGAGKSTLLRAISGTTEASGGAIIFDGRDITHMPSHEITARNVIHMPGGRGVFPGLSVRDNLMLANWLVDDAAEIQKGLAEAFEIFPILKERADTLASALSGGEQQQLSLAQAFLGKPRLLMIDELSLGLSPAVVAELLDVVREIHRRGVTIIVVEQSVNVALTIADKAVFMEKGEVKFFGDTSELLSRPDILRAVYVKGTGALTAGAPSGARRTERQQRELDLGESRPILQVEGLVKRYGGITAVDGVTFDLREGEVLGLIGPNGAGKTTIFDLISGFQVPDQGRVGYEGVDITKLTPEARARRKLIRRFQDARLFPSLTVFETLLIALEEQLEVKSSLLNAAAMPQARRAERRLRARAERLVELLELGAYRDKFVKELSTGLRRILDLACVLGTEPKVLLLDEPSSGIAQAEAEGLAPLLRRVRFESGCSILIIEHDMPLISSVSDELVALDRGKVVLRGSPEVVLNDERVIESYLGTTEAAVQRSGRIT